MWVNCFNFFFMVCFFVVFGMYIMVFVMKASFSFFVYRRRSKYREEMRMFFYEVECVLISLKIVEC